MTRLTERAIRVFLTTKRYLLELAAFALKDNPAFTDPMGFFACILICSVSIVGALAYAGQNDLAWEVFGWFLPGIILFGAIAIWTKFKS